MTPMKTNTVGWFEVYVADMPRAKQFYETVFATTLEKMPMPEGFGDMEMQSFPGHMDRYGANGALVKMAHVQPGVGGTLVYFSCEDCAVEAGRAEEAGGKVQQPKFSIGEFGFISMVQDTEGNTIGLHSAK